MVVHENPTKIFYNLVDFMSPWFVSKKRTAVLELIHLHRIQSIMIKKTIKRNKGPESYCEVRKIKRKFFENGDSEEPKKYE